MTKVADSFKCPKCGENDMDKLEISDDDYVTCSSCGEVYDMFEIINSR